MLSAAVPLAMDQVRRHLQHRALGIQHSLERVIIFPINWQLLQKSDMGYRLSNWVFHSDYKKIKQKPGDWHLPDSCLVPEKPKQEVNNMFTSCFRMQTN